MGLNSSLAQLNEPFELSAVGDSEHGGMFKPL